LRDIKLAIDVGSLLSGPGNFMLWAREAVVALIDRFPHLGIQERGNGVARVLAAKRVLVDWSHGAGIWALAALNLPPVVLLEDWHST